MSSNVFPTFAGLLYPVTRRPVFNTKIQQSVSGKEVRINWMAYPNYEYEIAIEGMKLADWQNLMGHFTKVKGMYDDWLFNDTDDNSVTDMPLMNTVTGGAVGDGATKTFQLMRSLGGFNDIVQNVNVITNVKVNGSITAAYAINSTGLLTFTVAPPNTQTVTWTGTYYWRCRFLDDAIDIRKVMQQFWETQSIRFRTVKL